MTSGYTARRAYLDKQVEADKYLASKDAVGESPAQSFARIKIVPPGTA